MVDNNSLWIYNKSIMMERVEDVYVKNPVEWNDRFNIGIESIDKAHRRLFSIVCRLIELNEDEEKSRWACMEAVKYFKNYAIKHFEEEEAYMKSIQYGGCAVHKRLHDDLRDKKLPALEEEMEESDYSEEAVGHFIGNSIGWLTGHIMIEEYPPYSMLMDTGKGYLAFCLKK